jgi:type IV pilus assembly protein PilM
MAKSIVGVDISSNSIRAVEVADAEKARPTVVRFAEVPTPSGSVSKGEVIEPNTVATALKELWSLGRFRSKNVILGMGNQRVLSRDLTVPRATLAQIRESLPFQVQDMLPVPVVDAILDFYPTSEAVQDGVPVLNGLLIAAVKDAVLSNVRAVQLAGLNPAGVDLIPFALSRILVSRAALPGAVALVEVGAETTSVVIVSNGVPRFVRIIPTGGVDITRALAGRLDIGEAEAEAVKRYLGLGANAQTPDDHRAAAVINELANELMSSLRNTINYYVNTHPAEHVNQIILSGGGSHLQGFAGALTEFAQIPVATGRPFGGATFARSIPAEELELHGTSIAVAYGLAVGSRAA